MKIGLCTLYGNINIGNKLQNYALLKLVEETNNRVDTIVTHLTERGLEYRIKSVLAIFLSTLGVKKASIRALSWSRERRFEQFSKEYLNITNRVKFDDCHKLAVKYDFFITGSDQVWHKWPCAERTNDPNAQLKYFYLMFAPPEKRISFAPSFGFEIFPNEDIDIHRKGLGEIKCLSCREERAKELIKELVDREAVLLPDPTLCISMNQWSVIERKPKKYRLPKRYILVYFLGKISKDRQNVLNNIAKQFESEIVNIYDVHHEDGIHNEKYYLTNPNEFIYLIHNAEFIATDSFHACVFSIIFHKRFMAFRREEQHMDKMFNRIENLIDITALSNCIYTGQEVDEIITAEIDYKDADGIINNLRENAKLYLKSSLNTKIDIQ